MNSGFLCSAHIRASVTLKAAVFSCKVRRTTFELWERHNNSNGNTLRLVLSTLVFKLNKHQQKQKLTLKTCLNWIGHVFFKTLSLHFHEKTNLYPKPTPPILPKEWHYQRQLHACVNQQEIFLKFLKSGKIIVLLLVFKRNSHAKMINLCSHFASI